MATCCSETAIHVSMEIAVSQYQERAFIDRVLGHFVTTYDTPGWCQCCLGPEAKAMCNTTLFPELICRPRPWQSSHVCRSPKQFRDSPAGRGVGSRSTRNQGKSTAHQPTVPGCLWDSSWHWSLPACPTHQVENPFHSPQPLSWPLSCCRGAP